METRAIEDRIRRVVESAGIDGIISVYLFGSVADGREHRESDLDVGVVLDRTSVPTEAARFERRLLLTSALSGIAGRPADVVILNDAPATFSRAVITHGRRILCIDPEADHAFVRDVLLQAPDLEMFLRRMRAIKLDAIARR